MPEARVKKQTKIIKVSQLYIPEKQWEMFNLSWAYLGYSRRGLAKNALQGFFARNKKYYVETALQDAEARNISQHEHYELMQSGKALPNIIETYNQSPSPISWVPNLMQPKNTRTWDTLEISQYNYTLLKFAMLLDGGSLPSVISKCLYAHLGEADFIEQDSNLRAEGWARSYYPQIFLNANQIYSGEIGGL